MTDLMPIKESKTIITAVRVHSSSIKARMIANFRNHHLVIDAPDYAGGPGKRQCRRNCFCRPSAAAR